MSLNRSDLGDFVYFIAVARHQNFRKAATECGVSASAISHAISGLEERLGVRLLNRTTRSVTLTAAGEEMLATIQDPMEGLERAIENLNRYREAPSGRIRLNVMEDAATLILQPVLPAFLEHYPDVEVDVSVTNRLVDVIGGGFDAGIRYGGTVPEDMIAQSLSAKIPWVAAAAPAYLERAGTPQQPEDLRDHHCIRIRLGNDQLYDWEFDMDGETVAFETPGQVTIDQSGIMLGLGLQGAGVIYGTRPLLQPHFDSGALVPVLTEWSSLGPGFQAYYSGRRHLPAGLRLLIDLIREMKPCGL